MTKSDPCVPKIAWRRGFTNLDRVPVVLDVHDGRAEYLLSGPYRMAEGSKIEVIDGQLLFTGSSCRIS